ncbi:MAG: FMN-binding protein [Verrucomicrobiota bacterium]
MERRVWRERLVQGYRLGVVLVLVLLVRAQHEWMRGQRVDPVVTVEDVREWLPGAMAMSGAMADGGGGRVVLDAEGEVTGMAVVTSPESDWIVGYSGPTTVLLVFDEEGKCVGVRVLESGDTPDHLEEVLEDEDFLAVYEGRTWDEIAGMADLDGVSGATLTSLAIREGVTYRLRGERPNLRFPEGITIEEARVFFPEGETLVEVRERPRVYRVEGEGGEGGEGGEVLGHVVRTGHLADRVRGYQGPTDVLVGLDAGMEKLVGVRIRKSYDNGRYVEDIEFDRRYFDKWKEREVAGFDVDEYEALGIDGVSGATMTSWALGESVWMTMRELGEEEAEGLERGGVSIRVSAREVGILVVVGLSVLMAFTGLRRVRGVRLAYQLFLIVYVGFISGDMVAQALLLGWAESGVAWAVSPGLVLLVGAAFLLPAATGRQVYCHHVCPHGALQQLIMRVVPRSRRVTVPAAWDRVLVAVPAVLLGWVLLVGMLGLGFDVAGIEPFDAYVWRAAGWATVTVFVVSVVLAIFVPMGYCRYGCPTGRLLEFVRYRRGAERFGKRELWGAVIVLVAVVVRVLTINN